jgi:hypothetical protein
MAYGMNPRLDPNQVRALLAGWVDIVGQGDQVGRWGGYGFTPPLYAQYGAYGRPTFAILGADPVTGAPTATPVPPGTPGAVQLPPAPMAAPPPPPMMQPPMAPQMMAPPPPAQMQMPFPPRAALVDAPPPTFAARDILPLSTGVPILPTQSAQITGRPQARAFRGDRFMVSNAGTAGGAADWIINDIKIGNRSQFVQSGDVPGDLFAVNAIDTFVRFETAQTAMDIVIVVTYIGLNESGAPFFAALVGTAAI